MRTISGVDERNLAAWVAESGKVTGAIIVSGAGIVGEAGKSAGIAVAGGAGKAAEAVGAGAKKAGQTTQRGVKAYIQRWIRLWKTPVKFGIRMLRFIWMVISFIPRRLMGLFKPKDKQIQDPKQ